MALSAPCSFNNTEQNFTLHCFSSPLIMRSSSSATASHSLLSEEDVNSDPGSVVLINTSLNTDVALKVRGCQTISEVKEKLMRFHSSNFPIFGEIKIIDIKFKCQSCFHSLEDSMPMRMILNERKHVLQRYVDASSSVEHHGDLILHNWSDTDEDSQGDNGAIGQEESGDLQSCLDSPVAITPCSICLRGLGASSLGPRETDDKEMSLEGLPKNPLDKKRKKPTPKKISSRKKDPKGKRHMPKQVRNSVPTFESRAKPNEENFHTELLREGTLPFYSSNKTASSCRKEERSDEKSSNNSAG